MKAKQITTYHVKGEAKTWEKALAPEDESKSVNTESGITGYFRTGRPSCKICPRADRQL